MTWADVTTVLCDADGNLFPSEEPAFVASAEVTNAYLAALGVDVQLAAETLRLTTTGKNFRTTAVDLAVAHGVPIAAALAGRHPGARLATDGDGLTPELLETWVREERHQVSRYLGEVLRPDDAVLEPLNRLAKAHRLAVVSSSAPARLEACFAATELDQLLPRNMRFSAEDSLPVPTSKPDPAVYLFACRHLRVAPALALAVEDSLPGAQSAIAAGIVTIGNLQFVAAAEQAERRRQLTAAGASLIVRSWAELADRLDGAAPLPALR